MKVGYLLNTNSKGQLVIPARVREQLQINEQVPLQLVVKDQVIHIVPVTAVFTKETTAPSYLDVLKQTQGSWQADSASPNRTKLELKASARRKAAW